MNGLETVLAAHAPQVGPISGCWKCPEPCGATSTDHDADGYPAGREKRAAEHRAHVAAAIREYLLSDAVVEAAARVIANVECADWSMPEVDDDTWPVLRERNMRTARAALTAATEEDVRDAQ